MTRLEWQIIKIVLLRPYALSGEADVMWTEADPPPPSHPMQKPPPVGGMK